MPHEQAAQEGVVDTRKKLLHVELQRVAMTPGEVLGPIQSGVRALARTAGIGIVDKTSLPDGLNDSTERVMHHAVAEGRGTDQAELAILGDTEAAVGTGSIATLPQFFGELVHMLLGAKFKRRDIRTPPLAPARGAVGREQVLKGADPVIELAEGFGHRRVVVNPYSKTLDTYAFPKIAVGGTAPKPPEDSVRSTQNSEFSIQKPYSDERRDRTTRNPR